MVRRVGGQRAVVPGRRAKGGAKSVTKKVFLKLFRNNSQRLSLVRLGHRHSINQSNRLQLTTISFSIFLSCIAYIHSVYLYSAPSRKLLRRNLRHLNWYRRLGSLAIPCNLGTITESSLCSNICLRNVSLPRCYTNDQDFLRSGQSNSVLLLLNLGPTLAPLSFSLDIQQPRLFPNFRVALQVLPTLAISIVSDLSPN